MTRQYLNLDEVIELHRVLIEEFGGSEGIRDLFEFSHLKDWLEKHTS